jgi:hypothetical protein
VLKEDKGLEQGCEADRCTFHMDRATQQTYQGEAHHTETGIQPCHTATVISSGVHSDAHAVYRLSEVVYRAYMASISAGEAKSIT